MVVKVENQINFYGCKIKAFKEVFLPRQETELLVEKVSQSIGKKSGSLLDLCCGSGCIGIAMKNIHDNLSVDMSDISLQCVRAAARNAVFNRVEVNIIRGDLLSCLFGKKYRFVTCNPPYIKSGDIDDLDVRNVDPIISLDGGDDGLFFYRKLEKELPSFLYEGSNLFFEIGYNQGDEILSIYSGNKWSEQKVTQDWAGHDRFFTCEFCGV